MKTIRERAINLKRDAMSADLFNLDLPESRALLNELTSKYGFEGALVTNSELKLLSIITKQGQVTL